MRQGTRSALIAAACLGLAGCFRTVQVKIERLEPPLADVHGIRELAVLPFADRTTGLGAGGLVAEKLAAVVVSTGRYRVMKIDQVNKRLSDAGVNFTYPPDAAMVRKIGSVLGVDAVLCGELQKFSLDETGRVLKSRERVWTDEYVRDREGGVISDAGPRGESVPRKRMEMRVVEKNALRRSAVLDIEVRMSDGFLGNVICAESESESGSWEGTGAAGIAKLPGREVIFDLLLDRAAKKFVRQIAAHPIEEERVLERGAFHATNLGVELAKNDLWDEATDKWLQATKAKPDEAAAYYNLGIAFERKGIFDFASKAYQNALARNPQSERYIKAVAAIQKLIKDLE
jgi:hypothetical protein